MSLTKQEVNRIANEMVEQIQKSHHEFWIDPKSHYDSHKKLDKLSEVFTEELIAALKDITASYKQGRRIVWTMFLTLVSLGALWTAFNGWIIERLPK